MSVIIFNRSIINLRRTLGIFSRGGARPTLGEGVSLSDVPPVLPPVCSVQRWGVREEATNEHGTSQICVAEIRRCAAARPAPDAVFLLIILGDKYGYRPFPAVIPEAELKMLRGRVAHGSGGEAAAGLLDTWFELDLNALDHVQCLRSADAFGDAQAFWGDAFPRMQAALRAAAGEAEAAGELSKV